MKYIGYIFSLCTFLYSTDFFRTHAGFSPIKIHYSVQNVNDQKILSLDRIEKNRFDLGRADKIIMKKVLALAQERKIASIRIPRTIISKPLRYLPEASLKKDIIIEDDDDDYSFKIFSYDYPDSSLYIHDDREQKSFIRVNLSTNWHNVVAFNKDKKIIGFSTLFEKFSPYDFPFMARLYVLSTYRRLGLGTKLLAITKEIAQAHHYSHIHVSPAPWGEKIDSMEKLIAWYKKNGFYFLFKEWWKKTGKMFASTANQPSLIQTIIFNIDI